MKLLIVIMNLEYGGAERSLVNFLNELPNDKYKVDLLLFKKSGAFLSQVPQHINILETPYDIKMFYGSLKQAKWYLPVKILGNFISSILTKNSLTKRGLRWKYFYSPFIKKNVIEYDVAIAFLSGEDLYYVDEKVTAKKKLTFVHSDYKSLLHPKKYDYIHLRRMDNIVSISSVCVDILKEEFPEFSQKIVYLPNITSSRFVTGNSVEFIPSEFDSNVFTILSIGRLTKVKGFDLAIQAADILKREKVDFKWYIIGTGELYDELKCQTRNAHLEDYIVFLGSKENPYPYIKNCKVLVQPSRHEGKSIVLDEAKILAKPIVVTNYSTIRDQLNENEGLVVDITPEAIAYGIIKMLDEKMRNKYMSYLSIAEYGNQSDIVHYYNLID